MIYLARVDFAVLPTSIRISRRQAQERLGKRKRKVTYEEEVELYKMQSIKELDTEIAVMQTILVAAHETRNAWRYGDRWRKKSDSVVNDMQICVMLCKRYERSLLLLSIITSMTICQRATPFLSWPKILYLQCNPVCK